MKSTTFKQGRKSLLAILIGAAIAAGTVSMPQYVFAADSIDTVATSYYPSISETSDANGFKHPGVGLTKEMLENARAQVRAKKEPWISHFNQMLGTGYAGKTVVSGNASASDPTLPASYDFVSQNFNLRFIADGLKAYTQAVMYYMTGDEVYRSNAMAILRVWSRMDPARYGYFNDAHIHTGIPLSRMIGAAELMRATSCNTPALQWTEQDTELFTRNLIVPATETFNHTNWRFMNQHLYPLIGSMSGYIFSGNRERYDEAVEWFTVNKTTDNQGRNGAIKRLFRLVDKNDLTGEAVTPQVQHVEMGRDQAHGGGDITNAGILARLMNAQGTRVDPVEGTASIAANALGPYEFLNDRVLDATEYFAKYMLGNEVPWTPTAAESYADGTPAVVYQKLSPGYRGRSFSNTWDVYYYYKYYKGIDMDARAPYYTRFMADRTVYNWEGVDGGGDFWLTIPAQAEAEGARFKVHPVVDPYREFEERYTPLAGSVVAQEDSTAKFLRLTASASGAKVAIYSYGNASKILAFKVRTNGLATMEALEQTIALPDTKGQWRYVFVNLDALHGMDDMLFLTIKGGGTQVDIDHLNINGASMEAPVFTAGAADLNLVTYAGSTAGISISFAATDATAGDTITYQADNLPAGAVLNSSTGAFSWTPAAGQGGTYNILISASDGKSTVTRSLKVVVSTDRQAAADAVAARYKADRVYVGATLATFSAARADLLGVLNSASDAVFAAKLAALQSAATGLQELTPLLADGSIDFVPLLFDSSDGIYAPNLTDGTNWTFVTAPASTGYRPYDSYDFGPSFKVSASEFQLQVRAHFPDRAGGVVVFGSNDKENWTRLTPGLTVVTEDWQTMPVQDDLKNKRFRFLRVQMLVPTHPLFEMGELRIVGARYETVNKLTAVSLSSDQALRRRVVAGNTVKVTFKSSEAINNVVATVQGQSATVTTADNLNWTASWVVNNVAAAGNLKFLINYKTADGLDAEPTLFTTDASTLFVADERGMIGNPLAITTVKDSSGRSATDLLTVAGYLFDNNLTTGTDFRVSGSGYGGWVSFDFKGGGTATLSKAEILSRQDDFYGRIGGAVIQGSNDNSTWDTISNGAAATLEWQTLSANNQPYRYIRVYNGANWYGNMSELKLYGVVESTSLMTTASISSAQALRNRIVPGNTVKLNFAAKEAVNNVAATIQGVPAAVTTTDNINFIATAVLPQGTALGLVTFDVEYKTASGKAGYPLTAVSDATALYLVDEADVIRNLSSIATLIDSTAGRTAASTATITNYLFDANVNTGSDYRLGSSGTGGYITFDFKAGNQATLSGVELLARQDSLYTRARYTIVQGSNDNTNWTTLTNTAAATLEWQTLPVAGGVPYRYIRIWNATTWYGNLNEVRLHGTVQGADTTAPVTSDNAPKVPVSAATTVSFAATDESSGVAATYFKANGGAQQTGNAVAMSAEGTYALSYWSVDRAGNTEQPKSATVIIDKSAPVTSVTSNPAPQNGWYGADVTLAFAAADANPGASTWFSVDGAAQQSGNSMLVSGKGMHTVAYWSVDQAGNVEQPNSVLVNIGPIDVTASVKLVQYGATLNRATGKSVASVTITNTSGASLTGPFQLKLNGLSSNISLDNASGADGGAPYVTLSGPLAAGASVSVPLTFSNPNRAAVVYTSTLYQGNF